MRGFFESLAIIFLGLFFGTIVIVFGQLIAISGGSNENATNSVPFIVLTLALVLVGWQGWSSFKELHHVDTKQNGVARILGILTGLFVWYFSCGGMIFGSFTI